MSLRSFAPSTRFFARLIGVCAAAFTLSMFSLQVAQAQTAVRVAQAGAEGFAFAPVNIGIERGIFKKQGLNVEVSTMVSSRIIQAMVAGGVDIGLSAGTDLSFATKAPVKGVAALAGPPTDFALVTRPDGSVKTAADLKGRSIAISATHSLTDWLAARVAVAQGWGPKGVTTVAVGDTAARFAALKTKNADAAVVDIASALQLEQRGQGRILVRFGDLVPEFLTHAIIASDALIANKPETIRAFLKGWFETIAYIRAHKAESVALGSKITGVSPEVEARVYDELVSRPFFSDDGRFGAKALAALDASWIEMGTLTSNPDPATLYTEEFLPAR